MAYRGLETVPDVEAAVITFGTLLRAGRYRSGFSQDRLEHWADVDQTAISRLERAKAPAMAVMQVIKLGMALGPSFPLGFCPHDHDCAWPRPPTPQGRPVSTSRLRTGRGQGWRE